MTVNNQYPFRTKKFKIDGHSLSYIDEGEGRVIVMLHGNPTWSFFYRNLIELLRDRYRVIVPDHMGCGFSDKPQDYPYRLADHVSNVEKLLDHLQIEKHSLVLHDWGGAIGMGYAANHPRRIEALVIMNSAAFRSTKIPWRIAICRVKYLGPLLVRGLNLFARAALFMAVKKRMDRQTRKAFLAPYDSWKNRIAVMRFIEDIPLDYHHPSWEALMKAEGGLDYFTENPTLILWGGRDFCFNDDFFNEWQRRFPKARSIYLESAGHYLLEDADGEVDHLISGFLDEYLLA
ncbi:MAG: alpha/beta fold hydrolase [Thermodesulfobacteriota bacterium]